MRLRGHAFHVVRSASNSTYSTIMYPAIPAILARCPIADPSPATLTFAYY